MKKFFALALTALMALSLCACTMPEENTPEAATTAAPAPEEAVTTEAPVEPPIEIGEFCDPEEMPAADLPEMEDDAYSITVGDRSFTLKWLYEHNIYDWRQAGISYEQVEEKTGDYMDLAFSAEALEALKAKISDFTMLVMLTPADGSAVTAPEITVDDEVYDLAWLSSHNSTDYTDAGIDAGTVKQYLESMENDFWYTKEYRWIEEVYNRLVNGWN